MGVMSDMQYDNTQLELAIDLYDSEGGMVALPVNQTLMEERRKLGKCIYCGTTRRMTAFGLNNCEHECESKQG